MGGWSNGSLRVSYFVRGTLSITVIPYRIPQKQATFQDVSLRNPSSVFSPELIKAFSEQTDGIYRLTRPALYRCGGYMKTLLLADDEPNLRMLARITLEDPKYRIIEAADGTSALELARIEHPDLLVLDWMMPGMSGIEVARSLRQDPATASIPIIMLTSKGQEADKEQGRAVGAFAYLVKPFSPLELLEKVEQVLQ